MFPPSAADQREASDTRTYSSAYHGSGVSPFAAKGAKNASYPVYYSGEAGGAGVSAGGLEGAFSNQRSSAEFGPFYGGGIVGGVGSVGGLGGYAGYAMPGAAAAAHAAAAGNGVPPVLLPRAGSGHVSLGRSGSGTMLPPPPPPSSSLSPAPSPSPSMGVGSSLLSLPSPGASPHSPGGDQLQAVNYSNMLCTNAYSEIVSGYPEDGVQKLLEVIVNQSVPVEEFYVLNCIKQLCLSRQTHFAFSIFESISRERPVSAEFCRYCFSIFFSNGIEQACYVYNVMKNNSFLSLKEVISMIYFYRENFDTTAFKYYNDILTCHLLPTSLHPYYPLMELCHSTANYEEAKKLYLDILRFNIRPDLHIYSFLMDLARVTHNYQETDSYYEDLIRMQIQPDASIYRCLLLNYKDAQMIEKAEELFYTLCSSHFQIDHSLYSPLLEVYILNKQQAAATRLLTTLFYSGVFVDPSYYDALHQLFSNNSTSMYALYDSMTSVCMVPPPEFYVTLFSSSQDLNSWERSYNLFLFLKAQDYPFSPAHYAALIKSGGKNQRYDDIIHIYESYEGPRGSNPEPLVQLIHCCRMLRFYDAGWTYFSAYINKEKDPSISVFIAAFQLCQKMNNSNKSKRIINDWESSRVPGTTSWYILLINYMVERSDYESADKYVQKLLSLTLTEDSVICLLNYYKMIEKHTLGIDILRRCTHLHYDANQYNIILETCKVHSEYDLGLSFLEKLKEYNHPQTKNTVSTILSFYRGKQDWEGGVKYFEERKKVEGPNNHLYFSMMALCKEFRAWEYAKQLMNDLVEAGVKPSSSMQSAVLSLYRDCGQFDEAKALYEDFLKKGKVAPVVHGCMISIYGDQGKFDEGFRIYERIKHNKDELGNSTYCALFHNCAKLRDWPKASQLYDEFIQKGIEHNAHIYSSLLSVCKVTGNRSKIEELIKDMRKRKVKPDAYLKDYIDEFKI